MLWYTIISMSVSHTNSDTSLKILTDADKCLNTQNSLLIPIWRGVVNVLVCVQKYISWWWDSYEKLLKSHRGCINLFGPNLIDFYTDFFFLLIIVIISVFNICLVIITFHPSVILCFAFAFSSFPYLFSSFRSQLKMPSI